MSLFYYTTYWIIYLDSNGTITSASLDEPVSVPAGSTKIEVENDFIFYQPVFFYKYNTGTLEIEINSDTNIQAYQDYLNSL